MRVPLDVRLGVPGACGPARSCDLIGSADSLPDLIQLVLEGVDLLLDLLEGCTFRGVAQRLSGVAKLMTRETSSAWRLVCVLR